MGCNITSVIKTMRFLEDKIPSCSNRLQVQCLYSCKSSIIRVVQLYYCYFDPNTVESFSQLLFKLAKYWIYIGDVVRTQKPNLFAEVNKLNSCLYKYHPIAV